MTVLVFPTCGRLHHRQFKGLKGSDQPASGRGVVIYFCQAGPRSLMSLSVTALGVGSSAVIMGVTFLRSRLSREDAGGGMLY